MYFPIWISRRQAKHGCQVCSGSSCSNDLDISIADKLGNHDIQYYKRITGNNKLLWQLVRKPYGATTPHNIVNMSISPMGLRSTACRSVASPSCLLCSTSSRTWQLILNWYPKRFLARFLIEPTVCIIDSRTRQRNSATSRSRSVT